MTSRACRALLALALFLGAASLPLGSAHAEQAPAAKPEVAVGIGGVDPQIPDFADLTKTMTFSGQIQNLKSTPLKNVVVELRRSVVGARSAMGSATGGGSLVVSKSTVKLPELAPGTPRPWKLTPTESELFGGKHPAAGIYAIDVDVKTEYGDFLGGQRTYVVWKPLAASGTKKARVALLWPVVGMPGLTGQKTANSAAAPIVSDPQAADQFKPDGRLDRILQYGQQFPVNWVLDPDVLYTADQLSNGFFPAAADGSAQAQGDDGSDPKYWYNAAHALFASAQPQNCWNLPYADPDLTTLAHSPGDPNLLGQALQVQEPLTTGGCRQQQTIAWPADGQADATTLKALQGSGAPDLVTLLSSNVVYSWKSAHVTLPQSPNTVVYDTYLSNVFAAETAPAGQPQLNTPGVLAGQLWLAQTALLAGDYTDRVLVVAPPRTSRRPRRWPPPSRRPRSWGRATSGSGWTTWARCWTPSRSRRRPRRWRPRPTHRTCPRTWWPRPRTARSCTTRCTRSWTPTTSATTRSRSGRWPPGGAATTGTRRSPGPSTAPWSPSTGW
ncbi:DUF6049 family protein [Catenulispora yoronensis]